MHSLDHTLSQRKTAKTTHPFSYQYIEDELTSGVMEDGLLTTVLVLLATGSCFKNKGYY